MTQAAPLRARAEAEAALLPPLLAQAEQLAGTVLLGEHGRRRAGLGDDFWQYRPVQQGDSATMIDWRRSARGDQTYVRQREWQVAQAVMFWVDRSASMRFASGTSPEKVDRARLLALSLAVMLIRGGERIGLLQSNLPPKGGSGQLGIAARMLCEDDARENGSPDADGLVPHCQAVFISDFLGHIDPVSDALEKASEQGVRGVLLQILDPAEERFPYKGRTVFESMGGTYSHETLKAGALQDRYAARLAERKDRLAQLARLAGWQFHTHHTNDTAQGTLLWAWHALDQRVRR